ALRRARPAARGRVPLRHRLVLPAQEEVDEGAALVRPRSLLLPDLPPLPLPPRLLPREGAPSARSGRGPRPRAPDLGGRAERAARRGRSRRGRLPPRHPAPAGRIRVPRARPLPPPRHAPAPRGGAGAGRGDAVPARRRALDPPRTGAPAPRLRPPARCPRAGG